MSIIKFIPNVITTKVGRASLVLQKNSPHILMISGVVGGIAAAGLACKATLDADSILTEAQLKLDDIRELKHEKYSEQDRAKDRAIVLTRTAVKLGRAYAPSVILGVASIGAIVSGHHILNKRNLALVGAYASLEESFKLYRDRIAEQFGIEFENDIFHDIRDENGKFRSPGAPAKESHVTGRGGSMYARCFDETSTQWSKQPEYNQMFLQCQQNYANDLLKARGHVFLNEVYDMLGLERSVPGSVEGWLRDGDGDGYIDFGIFTSNNLISAQRFVNGDERSIWLDFNVDGVIYDKI